jgi:hypothetical protein
MTNSDSPLCEPDYYQYENKAKQLENEKIHGIAMWKEDCATKNQS